MSEYEDWNPVYCDEQGRCRDSKGRFARVGPDETCPLGCVRYGEWWVPVDCPTHLGGAQ